MSFYLNCSIDPLKSISITFQNPKRSNIRKSTFCQQKVLRNIFVYKDANLNLKENKRARGEEWIECMAHRKEWSVKLIFVLLFVKNNKNDILIATKQEIVLLKNRLEFKKTWCKFTLVFVIITYFENSHLTQDGLMKNCKKFDEKCYWMFDYATFFPTLSLSNFL